MTMRRFLVPVAAGCSVLLGVLSAGGAVAAGGAPRPLVPSVSSVSALVAPSRPVVHKPVVPSRAVRVSTDEGLAPGVDVTRLTRTSDVVNAAKVALYPKVTVRPSVGAPSVLGLQVAGLAALADPVTGLSTSIPAGKSTIPGLVSHVAPACTGTGTNGNRVQVLYVVEAGKVNRFSTVRPSLASFAADVDDVFALSARKTGAGRRVQWVQDGACNVSIMNVTVPAGTLGTSANVPNAFNGMRAALVAAGFNNPARKYLVFADAAALCGLSEEFDDSRKTSNYNDSGYAMFSRVDTACWTTDWTGVNPPAHELMHALGGVQADAPNGTIFGHCTDEADIMCYADGSGATMRQVCAADQQSLFDCGDDDYFNPGVVNPASYLGSHWNTADSSYLMAAPVLPAAVVVTGADRILSGTSEVFTASHSSVTAFQWSVQGPGGCTVSPAIGPSTTVSCPVNAGQGLLQVVASGLAPDGQLATGVKGSAVYVPSYPVSSITGPDVLSGGAPGTFTVVSDSPLVDVAWDWPWFCGVPSGVSTEPQVTIRCQPDMVGTLVLSMTGHDKYNQFTSASKIVTVTAAPLLVAQVDGPAVVAIGATATLTVSASNPVSVVGWEASNPSCTFASSGSVTTTVMSCGGVAPGAITVTATVTDVFEQVSSVSTNVMLQAPAFTIWAGGPTVLSGAPGVFTITGSNPVSVVTWSSSSPACTVVNGSTATVTVTCAGWNGALTLGVSAVDAYGQTATRTIPVQVTSAIPVGAFTVSATGPAVVRPGLTGVLSVTGSSFPVVSYAWTGSYGPCLPGVKTGASVVVQCPSWVAGTQTFTVTVRAADGRTAVASVPVRLGAATTATAAVGITRSAAAIVPGQLVRVYASVRYGAAPVRSTVQFYYGTNGRNWYKVGPALDTGTSGNTSLVVRPPGAGVTDRYKVVLVNGAGTGWAGFAQPATTVVVRKYASKASMSARSGRPDKVATRLTTTTGSVLKSQRMYLQSRSGSAPWGNFRAYVTNTGGVVSAAVQPKRGTYYRWFFPGGSTVTGVYSSQVFFRY